MYYFSGTGNSLHMAKKLKEMLRECELIPIASLINQDSIITTSEKVGFVFPVYSWALPKIVYDFIEKIDLSNTKYIFAVATMGGFSRQYVAPLINELLKPKSKELDVAYNLRIFSNNIWGSKRINPLPSKQKGENRIKKALLKLEKIAEIIRNNQKDTARKGSFYPMKGSYFSFMKEVNTMDEKYYSDENCNGCGICQKICPVDNIKIINEKPEWQHKCQMCTGCLHYCPQKAIQWGEYTLGRDRYNHPYIKVKELMNQKQVLSQ
ncbi:MAG: EFR1 family ferrodoxin [Candidatus Hodarchaeota archaeon]